MEEKVGAFGSNFKFFLKYWSLAYEFVFLYEFVTTFYFLYKILEFMHLSLLIIGSMFTYFTSVFVFNFVNHIQYHTDY